MTFKIHPSSQASNPEVSSVLISSLGVESYWSPGRPSTSSLTILLTPSLFCLFILWFRPCHWVAPQNVYIGFVWSSNILAIHCAQGKLIFLMTAYVQHLHSAILPRPWKANVCQAQSCHCPIEMPRMFHVSQSAGFQRAENKYMLSHSVVSATQVCVEVGGGWGGEGC